MIWLCKCVRQLLDHFSNTVLERGLVRCKVAVRWLLAIRQLCSVDQDVRREAADWSVACSEALL